MRRTRLTIQRTGLAASFVAMLALACGCAGNSVPGKVGLVEPERTLVLADPAYPGLPVTRSAVAQFAAAVTRRSHGRLRIEIRTGVTAIEQEQRTISAVASGRADLGWAEAHTFEAMGTASLRPIFVPMLVDSYKVQSAVLTERSDELLEDVMAATGVQPLALLAGGLRFAASSDHPIVTATDWTGRHFAISGGRQEALSIQALGATPVMDLTDRQTLTQNGVIDGAETTWRAYPASLTFVAPNVRLWPRAVVLAANPKAFGQLTTEQRGWLLDAAADAATWARQHAADADAPGLLAACRAGAKAALATPGELQRMRSAGFRRLDMAGMPSWATSMIQEVDRLRQRQGSEPDVIIPSGCAFTVTDAVQRNSRVRAALTGPGRAGTLPGGIYRYLLSEAAIARASDGNATPDYLLQNVGRWTWTFTGGRWTLDMVPTDSTFPVSSCGGWYTVTGDLATFTRTVNNLPGGDCVPLVWSAHFQVVNGGLRWAETDVADFVWVFQAREWRRL